MNTKIALFLMRYALCASTFMLLQACNDQKTSEQDEATNQVIAKIFSDYQEYSLRNFPERATYNGDHRYDDQLTDISEAAVNARFDSLRNFLKRIKALELHQLTVANKLNYDLFSQKLEQKVASEKFNRHYTSLTQQDGLHIRFPQIIESQPANSVEDFEKYFARLKGFEKQVDDLIDNMRKGLDKGYTNPEIIAEKVLEQVKGFKNIPTGESPFMKPLQKPDSLFLVGDVGVQNFEPLKFKLTSIIEQNIVPAYDKLEKFLEKEYLPKCRKDVGVWANPDGDLYYQYAVKKHTSTDLTAEQIFDLGMKEVKRISAAMEALKEEIGFKGTLKEFIQDLRTNPKFYYTHKDSLMEGFRDILKKMDKQLPGLFGRLPKAKYDLKELELYRAKSAPQAYYYEPPEDRSRPGYFYVNTYDLPSRPKYTMTALALHEAVPGHHLQITINQELTIPWFRKRMHITAFVEGWGLYAEHLGYEAGMYEEPYQHFGALTFEIWRACRLVVDPGIHYKKWTRQQAIDFMKEYTPNSELDIKSEIDRYIAWPGQALAYKIGELKIKELRKKAETDLGDKFDVKEFHDKVLENGAIPLFLLEKNIITWIEEN